MGHLLKTINPDRANALQRAKEPMPTMGMTVAFYGQSKHRKRSGMVLTGIVTGVDTNKRTVNLTIIYEARDMIDLQRVPEYDPDGSGWGWAFAEGSMVDVQAQVNKLQAQITELREMILGDFAPPEESVLSILDALVESVESVGAQKPARPAAPAKPRKTVRSRAAQ